MSARVFNPFVMSEMRRVISRRNSDAVGSVEGSGARGRRNLFGPVNQEENLKFLDRELAAILTRESERWGFDFERETPLPNANPRFVWERVKPEESIPESYAIRQLTILSQQKEVEISQGTDPASPKEGEQNHKTRSTKQSHITDFLKKRKRSLSAGDITATKLTSTKSNSAAQISSHLSSDTVTHKRSRTK